jgi:hypothetical protein
MAIHRDATGRFASPTKKAVVKKAVKKRAARGWWAVDGNLSNTLGGCTFGWNQAVQVFKEYSSLMDFWTNYKTSAYYHRWFINAIANHCNERQPTHILRGATAGCRTTNQEMKGILRAFPAPPVSRAILTTYPRLFACSDQAWQVYNNRS